MEIIFTFIAGIIIGILITAITVKFVYHKKHGSKSNGKGCIRDCKNCSNPCHHKGRF